MCGGLPRPCGLRTRPAIRLGLLPFLRSQLARGQPSPGRLGCLFFLSMAPQAHGPYLLPHLGLDLFGHPSCSLAKETIPGPSWSRFLLSRPFPGFRRPFLPGGDRVLAPGSPALFPLPLLLELSSDPARRRGEGGSFLWLEVSLPCFCAARNPLPDGAPPPGVHVGAHLDCTCSSCTCRFSLCSVCSSSDRCSFRAWLWASSSWG